MAKNVKKVPFPDFLQNTPCVIELHSDRLSEDGSPELAEKFEGKCIYSEAYKRVIDKDGKQTLLRGKVIVKGDIAPKLKTVDSGFVTINKLKMLIHSGSRPRNPDSTVHHTELEVK